MATAAPIEADAVAAACGAACGGAPSPRPILLPPRAPPSASFAPGGVWTSRGGEPRRRFSAALLFRFSLEGVAAEGGETTGGGVGGRAWMMHEMSFSSRSATRSAGSPVGELRCSPPSPPSLPPVGRLGVAAAVVLMVARSWSSHSASRSAATAASRGSEAGATPAIESERASESQNLVASDTRPTRWRLRCAARLVCGRTSCGAWALQRRSLHDRQSRPKKAQRLFAHVSASSNSEV
jgi:hypothetical protein